MKRRKNLNKIYTQIQILKNKIITQKITSKNIQINNYQTTKIYKYKNLFKHLLSKTLMKKKITALYIFCKTEIYRKDNFFLNI